MDGSVPSSWQLTPLVAGLEIDPSIEGINRERVRDDGTVEVKGGVAQIDASRCGTVRRR